jgi:competence ComEA-like helix-hairpin-helix protein
VSFSSSGALAPLLLTLAFVGAAQTLPDGPGKAETEKLCRGCHEVARSISLRQDREAWAATVQKMVSLGMKGSDADMQLVVDYLAKNYPADAVPPVNVNKAPAIEFESRLGLRRSQAAAIIRYRAEHGDFKDLGELKKVPGIDAALLEAKKDRLVF